jgi:hypothetical protein
MRAERIREQHRIGVNRYTNSEEGRNGEGKMEDGFLWTWNLYTVSHTHARIHTHTHLHTSHLRFATTGRAETKREREEYG